MPMPEIKEELVDKLCSMAEKDMAIGDTGRCAVAEHPVAKDLMIEATQNPLIQALPGRVAFIMGFSMAFDLISEAIEIEDFERTFDVN